MKKILFILLTLSFPALLLAEEPIREWKSNNGFSIQAAFDPARDSDPTTVPLVKDGKQYRVRFKSLSKADQDYVTRFRNTGTGREGGFPLMEETPKAPSTPQSGPQAGERKVFTVNGVKIAFRFCPPGTFTMGSPTSEEGRYARETEHQVTFTRGFWMMETEVTVGMFKAFVNETGYESNGELPTAFLNNSISRNSKYSWFNPGFSQDDNYPVTTISWKDALFFCKWLSMKTGQDIMLPTESQWEYACRAGTIGAFAGSLDDMTWYESNSDKHAHPVGTKKPNAWGLYDMHGNVFEWCHDVYKNYPSGSVTDPEGPPYVAAPTICRGGSWVNEPDSCRSASRAGYEPLDRLNSLGFRCVCRQ